MKKLLTAFLLIVLTSAPVYAEQQVDFDINGMWYITSPCQKMNYSVTKDAEGNYHAAGENVDIVFYTDGKVSVKDSGGVKLKKRNAKSRSFQMIHVSCILKKQTDFMNTGFMAS